MCRPTRSSASRRPRAHEPSTHPTPSSRTAPGKCTFEILIDDFDLGDDAALGRLAQIVHAADIESDLHMDPAGPGLLAIGIGGLYTEPDDHRLLERAQFVYDALYAWCVREVAAQPA
jgi:hypothetical protein